MNQYKVVIGKLPGMINVVHVGRSRKKAEDHLAYWQDVSDGMNGRRHWAYGQPVQLYVDGPEEGGES